MRAVKVEFLSRFLRKGIKLIPVCGVLFLKKSFEIMWINHTRGGLFGHPRA